MKFTILLYENRKVKLLTFLKMGINPFKKFVSTGEIEEELGLVPSREDFLNLIMDIIEKNENFILPIISEVGVGKTHLYWSLKRFLLYYNTIYISLENVYRKFYYNVYSEYIEEMGGGEVLRSITNKLCGEWGALERKFGFFQVADIDKVRKTAFEKLSFDFENKMALNDVINAITSHQLDPYKKIEAERWLLGELMDFKDLSHLHLLYDLKRKSYAYTILKIIIENSKLGSVLFIDDFEKIISLMKTDTISEEIFDPSWLYGEDHISPETISAQKTLDNILELQKIRRLRIIITLKSIDSLEEIKKVVQEKDNKLLLMIKEPLFISNFLKDDILQFYKENIKQFLKDIKYLEFLDEFPTSYFPLNEKILNYIQNYTQGNPREIIKYLIRIFNEIIDSDEKLENIIRHYENLV